MEPVQLIERLGGMGLAVLMLFGAYKVAIRVVDKVGVPIVERVSSAFDRMGNAMDGILQQLVALRHEATVNNAVIQVKIEESAKETRHDIRNAVVGSAGEMEQAVDEHHAIVLAQVNRVEQSIDDLAAEVRAK